MILLLGLWCCGGVFRKFNACAFTQSFLRLLLLFSYGSLAFADLCKPLLKIELLC